MPENFPEVKPGDLITAAYMNALRAHLIELNERVKKLEEAGAPGQRVVITSLAGGSRPGEILIVNGENFETPANQNDVTIDGLKVTNFGAGSGSSLLSFQIPPLPQLPRSVPIVVSNRFGSDSDERFIQPVVITQPSPQGRLVFATAIKAGTRVTPGAELEIRFLLDLQANTKLVYQLLPIYVIGAGASAQSWRQNTRILNAAGNPIDEVELETGNPVPVTVAIRVPPNAQAAAFALRAAALDSAKDLALSRISSIIPLLNNQNLGESDPSISFGPPKLKNARIEIDKGGFDTIVAQGSAALTIQVPVLFEEAGNYIVEAELLTGEEIGAKIGVKPSAVKITKRGEQTVTIAGKASGFETNFPFPTVGAAESGLLELRVGAAEVRDSRRSVSVFRFMLGR